VLLDRVRDVRDRAGLDLILHLWTCEAIEAGTFELILPMPAPPFAMSKNCVRAALERAVLAALIVSNSPTSTFLIALVRMCGPEVRLVGVHTDPQRPFAFAASSAPRPQPPATWKTMSEPWEIWFSAIDLHLAGR
jgi:hypothetical protein